MNDGDDVENVSRPPDTMRERTGDSRLTQWLLLTGDRLAGSGLLLVGTFVIFVLLSVYGPHALKTLLTTDAVGTLFSSIVIAMILSVTLVLTLAQFVLAQQLDQLGPLRERMAEATAFHHDIETSLDRGVNPAEPASFLQSLIQGVEAETQQLKDEMTEDGDPTAASSTTASR